MNELVEVAKAGDIPVGTARVVTVRGRALAVFHTAAGWRCIDDMCPHRGASLAAGEVVGEDVMCPWHSWPFNLCDGRSAGSDFWKVDAYPVEVTDDGAVRVRVPIAWEDENAPA